MMVVVGEVVVQWQVVGNGRCWVRDSVRICLDCPLMDQRWQAFCAAGCKSNHWGMRSATMGKSSLCLRLRRDALSSTDGVRAGRLRGPRESKPWHRLAEALGNSVSKRWLD